MQAAEEDGEGGCRALHRSVSRLWSVKNWFYSSSLLLLHPSTAVSTRFHAAWLDVDVAVKCARMDLLLFHASGSAGSCSATAKISAAQPAQSRRSLR